MIIYQHFTFDSAHFLPNVPEGHKCRQLHGHTYHFTIFISGKQLKEEGWILDFSDLKTIVQPIISMLDHHLLNEIDGLANPTAEILAKWIWNKVHPLLPSLTRIELKETPTTGVIYDGDNLE